MGLLAEDAIGTSAGQGDRRAHELAFRAIDEDPAHLLVVADDGEVIGTMQLTLLPGLSRGGATRLHIEGVRVRSDRRSGGLGQAMIEWSIGEARRRGASLVQLTTNAARHDAHRFYARLGFTPSHLGFKLALD